MSIKSAKMESIRDLNLVEKEIFDDLDFLKKLKTHKSEAWIQEYLNNANSSLPPNNSK